MKEALRRRSFSSDEVIGKVQNWLRTKSKTFFLTELKKIVKRWNRCVEVEGDYVGK
jgi:hypothetical protein